ncbi:MAG: hypothetical protein U5K72_15960 [Balneolaceae bacterium]|nr:hypothetical protein [Balneolaceae bacterium]
MKLTSVYLHPFAGIRDKRFDLPDGLNVILWDRNEAGSIYSFSGYFTRTTDDNPSDDRKTGRYDGDLFSSLRWRCRHAWVSS